MNFDIGNVLTRAWQITWKNRVFWIFALLPFVIWMLYIPLFMLAFFWGDLTNPTSTPFFKLINDPASETLLGVGYIAIMLVALVIQVFSNAALTLGVVRAEAGSEKQNFGETFKASLPYVGRIFGAFLLIGIAVTIIFVIFMGCMFAVNFITMGIGSLFLQFLLYPIMFGVWIVAEQSQAAVIAEEMTATEAIGRAWDLLTSHIWKFLLVGVLIYIAQAIVSAIVTFPMVIPLWGLMYSSINIESAPSTASLLVAMLCMVALIPLYLFIMGISKTFTRSVFVVLYRLFTRDSEARQELLKVIASQETK